MRRLTPARRPLRYPAGSTSWATGFPRRCGQGGGRRGGWPQGAAWRTEN